MKKTILVAALLAVTALFLSCSNGSSSDSSSNSGNAALLNFNPVLFADADATEDITTSELSLSAGNWVATEVTTSTNMQTVYYYEFTVTDSSITCTKYQRYYVWPLTSETYPYLAKMSSDQIKSQYDLHDYGLSNNKFVGVKNYTSTSELSNQSNPTNTIVPSSGWTKKGNTAGTKYYWVRTQNTNRKKYWLKK